MIPEGAEMNPYGRRLRLLISSWSYPIVTLFTRFAVGLQFIVPPVSRWLISLVICWLSSLFTTSGRSSYA